MAQLFQRSLCGDQEVAPGVDQFDPPTDAAEQGLIKVILQHPNLMADRGPGDVQLLGGPGKALQTGGRLEADQGGKRREVAELFMRVVD